MIVMQRQQPPTFCSLAKLQMAQQHEGLPQPSTGPIGTGVLGGLAFLAVPAAAPQVMDVLISVTACQSPALERQHMQLRDGRT